MMPTPNDDDLSFLGLDPEKVAAVKRLNVNATAAGIDEGAQRVAKRYGTAIKIHTGATIVGAAALVAILVVLLVKD